MIEVQIKIHQGFQKYLSEGLTKKRFKRSIPKGSTVEYLLIDQIGLPKEVPKLMIVNGIHSKLNHVLSHEDRVAVFLPMAGG
jgi:hypothetical protein